MKRLVLIFSLAAAMAGCTSMESAGPPPPLAPPPPPIRRPVEAPPSPPTFRAEDFAWSAGAGPNAISGEVLYRGPRGERWTCTGGPVALTPETPYSRRRIQIIYGSTQAAVEPIAEIRRRSIANPNPEINRFVRTVRCTAHDTFAFSALPDGDYYLIAAVHPRRGQGSSEGVAVMRRVEIRGGGAHRIVLPEGRP